MSLPPATTLLRETVPEDPARKTSMPSTSDTNPPATQIPGLPPANAPTTQITIPRAHRWIVDAAFDIEHEDAQGAGEVGYAARLWTQLALPYTDPGDIPRWERRNGRILLVMRPATLVAPDGQTSDGYPFGVLPRYLLTWMATEAVRTQNPSLDLGTSFNDFMKKLGLGHNGRDAKRLKDQISRLVGASMQVQEIRNTADGQHVAGRNFTVADSFDLWLPTSEDDEDQSQIWNNRVTLSPQFYSAIVEAPVPVDLRAMRALRGAPMRLDIYTWLTHRLSYLSRTTLVPWAALEVQFGGQFARSRRFKEAFTKNLELVAAIYTGARFKIEPGGLRLYPSAPHVSPRGRVQIKG